MKKLVTLLVATLALGLVAFTPDIASAGRGHGDKGWHGGGQWHDGRASRGHAWRGGRNWHGSRGYGLRAPRQVWSGWWAPPVNIYVGPDYGGRCWSPIYGRLPCRYGWRN